MKMDLKVIGKVYTKTVQALVGAVAILLFAWCIKLLIQAIF